MSDDFDHCDKHRDYYYSCLVCKIEEQAAEIERLGSAFDKSQVALLMCVIAMEATHSDEAKYADMSDGDLAELWNNALKQGRAATSDTCTDVERDLEAAGRADDRAKREHAGRRQISEKQDSNHQPSDKGDINA